MRCFSHVFRALLLIFQCQSVFGISQLSLTASSAIIQQPDRHLSAGRLDLALEAGAKDTLRMTMSAADVALASVDGRFLAENLHFKLNSSFKQNQDKAFEAGRLDLQLTRGEFLSPFGYASFEEQPLNLVVKDLFWHDATDWAVKAMDLQVADLQAVLNNLNMQADQLALDLQLSVPDVDKIYRHNLQPVISSQLAMADVSGAFQLQLKLKNSHIHSYQLDLQQLNLQHQNHAGSPKYQISNLAGRLAYSEEQSLPGLLSFDSAVFLDHIELGETEMPISTGQRSIAIRETVEIPVFDGSLLIETFEISQSDKGLDVDFQGVLTPVSLELLTSSLQWPTMQGRISGIIPAIRYRDGNAELAGTMLIRVFDGDILIRDVKASHLLSSWPLLSADIQVRKLNLEPLTRTFSFGLISGLVNGDVENLVLENWQPTSFQARFMTAPESDSNRISQKAVDNISNLGGTGMAGALSRSFLRFFEDFGYDRLGISCILENGVCQMSGVEKAEQGYYLVKGRGIPRIDVIGYNEATDWQVLVDRLSSISSSGSPTIQ